MQAKKYKVLVVDDEEKICFLVKTFLELSSSFKVVTASDTVEANIKLNNEEFDILIIDNKLKNRTGLEFISMLKSSLKYNKLKIILMSGQLTQEDVKLALALKVKDIIVKPFGRKSLVSKIQEVLK
jgi:two-component system chemotaxis response regulator CheY